MIMYAQGPDVNPPSSLIELAEIAGRNSVDDLPKLERIKGTGRSLWSNGHLSEPPNWNGFMVAHSSGFGDSIELYSCDWYPSIVSAFAAVMMAVYETAGAMPDPRAIVALNGYLTIDFPENYYYVGRMNKDQYSQLLDCLNNPEEGQDQDQDQDQG